MIVTSAGLLPSKNIIHIVGQNDPANIKEVVYSVLKVCEDNKFSSVSFPALGTGLFKHILQIHDFYYLNLTLKLCFTFTVFLKKTLLWRGWDLFILSFLSFHWFPTQPCCLKLLVLTQISWVLFTNFSVLEQTEDKYDLMCRYSRLWSRFCQKNLKNSEKPAQSLCHNHQPLKFISH